MFKESRVVKKEYPDTIREFFRMFPDEKACLNYYLIDLRWQNDFTCPACNRTSSPWRACRAAVELYNDNGSLASCRSCFVIS
jgi:hypothetical protein